MITIGQLQYIFEYARSIFDDNDFDIFVDKFWSVISKSKKIS